MLTRRSFFILLAAPAIVRVASLMPIKPLPPRQVVIVVDDPAVAWDAAYQFDQRGYEVAGIFDNKSWAACGNSPWMKQLATGCLVHRA